MRVITDWCRQALAICAKDMRIEFRERTAVSAVLLFAVTSLVVVGFALSGEALQPEVAVPLLWVVLFFAAFSGLAHVFTEEEEGATAMALQMAADAGAVYGGKLLYNACLLGVVASVAVPLFLAATGMPVPHVWAFAAVVVSGCAALAAAATMTAAIIAKARARGALFGALGFPLVLPLLIMAVVSTRHAVAPAAIEWSWARDVGGLLSYGVMMVATSALVFPIVWESA
jgi:heme exporter protein B